MLQMLVTGTVSGGSSTPGHGSLATPSMGQCGEYNKRYAKLQDGLDSSISSEGKNRIERILNEIQLLTDVEKLLLYLKLPTGVPKDEHLRLTPPSCLPASNRREQGEAMTWMKSHLEEHGDVCMPKAEVYDEYKQYCVQHELRPLCNADFGKVMKTVFPLINTRRLGQRGQSKYFYGGLRKRLEHTVPSLPDLEVNPQKTEIENKKAAESEVFKASCKLVCEWADKLLEHRFNGVQSVAEHLVSSLYVNTKSVAAFTLIAAMQESGNQNLKGSALFNTQSGTALDKHRETNLLLQQKLHKNKVLQKQKEKLQTMKKENEQLQGPALNHMSDRKSGNTQPHKSCTPSKMSRTPKLSSPPPSPVQQSPRKYPSNVSLDAIVSMATTTTTKEPSSAIKKTNEPSHDLKSRCQDISSAFQKPSNENDVAMVAKMGDLRTDENNADACRTSVSSEEDIVMLDQSPDIAISRRSADALSTPLAVISVDLTQDEDNVENLSNSMDFGGAKDVGPKSSRETPYSEMHVNPNTMSHVRKISFDNVEKTSLDLSKACLNEQTKNTDCSGSSAKMDMCSKSAGHLSLKMLLERKDEMQSGLNKSTGLLEKSKNSLLVNKSNVAGRSAFVPFAQVQQPRRDPGDVTQTSSSINTPIIIPSSSEKSLHFTDQMTPEKQSQSNNVSLFAVPNNETFNQPTQRLPDNIIKIFPGAAAVQLSSSSGEKVSLAFPWSDSLTLSSNAKNTTKDSLTILTGSTPQAMSSGSETMVASMPNSPGISKHLRTRFTPIRPKGSPNKVTTLKDSKGDNPVYDKRPVSEILKEKRAKEQAEAFAKIQSGMNRPTLPFPHHISMTQGNLANFQQLQGVGSKDVVIIVNSKDGRSLTNLVNPTSNLTTHPLDSVQMVSHREEGRVRAKTAEESMNLTSKPDQVLGMSEKMDLHKVESVCNDNVITDLHENKDDTESDCSHLNQEIHPALTGSEMEVESVNTESTCNQYPLDSYTQHIEKTAEQEQNDKFEQIYTETPAKIAKLNITSPFRPDSACSLGRETPLRLAKLQEPCSSRPESACSYGRETPSGARKRKSSDYQQRNDFKRLNSTGDEGEEGMADLLSPGLDLLCGETQRRTQSCTFEMDRGVTHPVKTLTMNLSEGLQSPDITSLEEEALIESFPNSLFVMRPLKSQRHSIGVGARTVKVYQQRLLKQKQVLDKRVGTFLQQKHSNSVGSQSTTAIHGNNKVQTDFKVPFKSLDFTKKLQSTGDNRVEQEPSGLPSDVADWINETIEKRQTQNQSVLSEPELGVLNPTRSSTAIDFTSPSFHFEVNHDVRASSCKSGILSDKKTAQHTDTTTKITTDKNTFTVPKTPSLMLRVKDLPNRSGDALSPGQRCQSLPMFNSTSKSPVSPVSYPHSRYPLYQRAVSMSPKQQPEGQSSQTNLLSPVSGLTSPMRRIEVRDNHPISVSVHSVTTSTPSAIAKTREESFLKFTNYGNIGKPTNVQTDEVRMSQLVAPYLASIQHNLQKPNSSQELEHCKSRDLSFVVPSTKLVAGSKVSSNLLYNSNSSQMNQARMSSDNQVNLARFSDSGYHSTGTSPVLNTTPVSVGFESEGNQTRLESISQSPIAMSSSMQLVEHLSPKFQVSFPDNGDQVDGEPVQGVICSSTKSAFIPIQSSNQNGQFVTPTPIRPTVSLPNQIYQISTSTGNFSNQSSLFIDPNQSSVSQDVQMISPNHDPPPYETAVKALRQSNLKIDSRSSVLEKNGVTDYNVDQNFEIPNEATSQSNKGDCGSQRISLLANMGKDFDTMNKESFGPFASKLVQLSRQTKTSTLKPAKTMAKTPSASKVLYHMTMADSATKTFLTAGSLHGVTVNTETSRSLQTGQNLVTSKSQMYTPEHAHNVNTDESSDDSLNPAVSFNQSIMHLDGNDQSNLHIIHNRDSQSNLLPHNKDIQLNLFLQNRDNKLNLLTQHRDSQSNLLIECRDSQLNLLTQSEERSDIEQSGANCLLSPNSEQNLSAFNMDIDFLHSPSSPSSHSLFHLHSPPNPHSDSVLFSKHPSFQRGITKLHPIYKCISSTETQSFNQPGNVAHSSLLQNINKHEIQTASLTERNEEIHTKRAHHLNEHFGKVVDRRDVEAAVLNEPDSLIINEGLTHLIDQRNTELQCLDPRNERVGELPEDFDLMLQDLNELEGDLL